jgi:hypothetical protein
MLKTTVWRVLCKHLVFEPYCIQMVQQLLEMTNNWCYCSWGPLTLGPAIFFFGDMSKTGYSSHHCHVTSLTYRHRSLQHWRISMHPCWRVRGKNFNIVSLHTMVPMMHQSNISSCQKKLHQFSCGCEQFHYGRSFGFLVINVCNHREHYEMPCT